MQEFRATKNYKEIIRILERAQGKSGAFLWQNQGENRICFDIRFTLLDPIKQKISFEFLSEPKEIDLDTTTFVKIPIDDCAFKTLLVALNGREAVMDFPFDLVLTEKRKDFRVPFQEEDSKTAIFHNPMSDDPVLSVKGQTLRVSNVSKNGIAAFVTNQQSVRFQMKDKLFLNVLGDRRLPAPIQIEVVQKTGIEKRGQFGAKESGMLIGFHLKSEIPAEIFEAYTYSDRMVTFNDERFFKDQAFREAVHQGMGNTLNRLLNKQELKSVFQRLDIKREENKYLKNHIELLCEVTCQVGKDVGWITEKNLDKLIYVSYMHDIRYFERPYLARVADRREIEFAKSRYSKEDLQLFLESPAYAAELAKDDQAAFADSQKILLQQRERPDGKGFPLGIKGAQLAPLSCLFMVCHEFVDYLIEKPDWTYSGFVKQYNRIYTGPYFHKIFQVFDEIEPSP